MKGRFKKALAVGLSVVTTVMAMSLPTVMAEGESGGPTQEGSTYSGQPIEPDISVLSENGVQLTEGTDYDLSYENNTEVGTATINIDFKGNYSGRRTTTFEIVAKTASTDDITIDDIADQTFTGSEITPEPVVKEGSTTLVKDTDYTLSYSNNIAKGTGTVTVTFIRNFTGTLTKDFTIGAKDISTEAQFAAIDDATFTGSEITPKPVITWGSFTLVENTDYTLRYENNTAAGTATVYADFMGNYSGSASTTFEIVADALSNANVTFSTIANQTYTGSALTPATTLTYGSVTLVEGQDYDLNYASNVNVSDTPVVTATFKGNYSGTATTTFTIVPKDATNANDITIAPITDQTYTGSAITPKPVVTDTSR